MLNDYNDKMEPNKKRKLIMLTTNGEKSGIKMHIWHPRGVATRIYSESKIFGECTKNSEDYF